MADSTRILREYLLSLGFKVNSTENKKFDETLLKTTKLAMGAGSALVGIGTAAAAMVQVFANQMEKLYYASQRTGSTVQTLQSMQYAAKQVGVSSDAMQGAIENMARALRSNPGLMALLERLTGKSEKGLGAGQQVMDLVKALQSKAPYIAQQYASLFGLDQDTLFMLTQNIPKFEAAARARADMNASAGVDAEAAAKAAVEYNNALDQTLARVSVLKDALAIALLPTMREVNRLTDEFLVKLTQAVARSDWLKAAQQVLTFGHADDPFPKFDWSLSSPAMSAIKQQVRDTAQRTRNKMVGYGHMGGEAYGIARTRGGYGRENRTPYYEGTYGTPSAGGGVTDPSALFSRLEGQYGLPRGLLDSLWDQESGRGKNMTSPTGVKGHFQITGPNRQRLGITDPNDLGQEAEGAAQMMVEGLKKYGGDLTKALTYYNAGTDPVKLGTDEARNYAPSVMRKIEQHNHFHVTGVDAQETAQAIKGLLKSTNADLVREASVVQ